MILAKTLEWPQPAKVYRHRQWSSIDRCL